MTKVSFDEAIQDSALESSESLPLLTKRAEALSSFISYIFSSVRVYNNFVFCRYFSVFSKIRSLFFTVVLLFFTTFLVFPGFITSFRSSYGCNMLWRWLPVRPNLTIICGQECNKNGIVLCF